MSKTKTKTGRKPAFPTKGPFEPGLENSSFAYPGITIRDWFAGQAFPALLSELYAQSYRNRVKFENVYTTAAGAAYEAADAMLLARSLPEEGNG